MKPKRAVSAKLWGSSTYSAVMLANGKTFDEWGKDPFISKMWRKSGIHPEEEIQKREKTIVTTNVLASEGHGLLAVHNFVGL